METKHTMIQILKIKSIILVICCMLSCLLYAQHGTPYVHTYTKNDYAAAGRNWAIDSDSKGNIYVGNNSGLLRFNGSEWQLYPIPGNKIIRSIFCDKDDRIYIGSFEEFGFFESNHFGHLTYTSLTDTINFEFHNDEIWNIISHQGKIYFRSFTTYFTFDGHKVEAFNFPFASTYLTANNHCIYGYLLDKGLYQMNGAVFDLIHPAQQFNNSPVTAVLPFKNDKMLFFTTNNGIFISDTRECQPWKNDVNEQLKRAIINRVEITQDSVYIVGTISNGIYAINQHGKLLWQLNAENGLANNTVLALCCDNDNNIWAALDNGIAYIRYNSNLLFVNALKQNIGYVYSAALKDGYLYLATNQGLFFTSENEPVANMHLIKNTEGQSWALFEIDGQLFCGHNEGTLSISEQQAKLVSSVKGGTSFCKGIIHGQEVLVQSTYTHLTIYKKNQHNTWEYSHAITNFMHPIRFVEIDSQGTIWAQHFYKGVYRIKLSNDLLYATEIIPVVLPDTKKEKKIVKLFKIKGHIVLSNNSTFFTYDDLVDSIKPYNYLNEHLSGLKDIRKSIAVNNDRYWLVCSDRFVLVDFLKQGVDIKQEVSFASLYNDLPDNDENIIILPNNNYLFCLNNGVAILNTHQTKEQTIPLQPKTLRIEHIESMSKDGTIQLLPLHPEKWPEIPFSYNTLVFHVAFPHFSGENIKYSFKLEGVDDHWTIPTQQSFKEYARLYSGQFILHIKAIDNLGNELDTVEYRFEINAPFYASNIALLMYVLILLGIIGLSITLIRKKIAKNKQKILHEQTELRKQELDQQKHKIIQLKNEKLEADLTFKSKELASSTLSIIKKNEILVGIKDELTEQKEKLGTQYPNKYYDKLIHMIDSSLSSEDDWLIFQSNFDRIHENFFRNLKTTYPDLTSTDLKLCAFLRLNLNTKEIAHLMNITVKGVEVGRYRLRKKLKLASESSLVDFMINFK